MQKKNNMKINILTFHYANNYGAVLQCYALSKTLISAGHNVEIMNFVPVKKEATPIKSKLRMFFLDRAFNVFRENELTVQSNVFSDAENLTNNYPSADLYIVGSDQVWNPQITKNNMFLYFFSFLKNEKRIAYAASFGVDSWNWETNEIKNYLTKFSNIGIREKAGVVLCKDNFDLDSVKVIDPTLLLDSYDDLLKNQKSLNVGVATYKFHKDNNWYKFLNQFSLLSGLKVSHINDNKLFKDGQSFYFCSVNKWLNILKCSNLVITDSYHCMVFAIIFEKQFIALPAHPGRVSRMLSLLIDLGLSDRFFNNYEDVLINYDSLKVIDYDLVKSKIDDLKKVSLEFLFTSIKESYDA